MHSIYERHIRTSTPFQLLSPRVFARPNFAPRHDSGYIFVCAEFFTVLDGKYQ